MASERSTMSPRHAQITAIACTSCRRVKMKCLFKDGDTCERCIRLGLDCLVEKHRRGRKHGTRLKPWTRSSEQARDSKRHSFQPSDLLNKQATRGKFSLQTILANEDRTKATRDDTKDPISLGILNYPIALSLFDDFMRNFNPWICQFDTKLHTLDYVRNQSPFLLTSILAAAAKAFNSAATEELQSHAEELFATHFMRGTKSVDVIHAILVLIYWKKPEDTREWLSIGYAIRMGMELGMHKIDFNSHRQSESERRETRDMERLWLLLFVYDRSLSTQIGKPWMIERSEFFVKAVDTWYKDPLATSDDKLLCSLVSLRLITSPIANLLFSRHSGPIRDNNPTGTFINMLDQDIERWESGWQDVCTDAERPHKFLIQLHAAHLRLIFASVALESSLASTANIEYLDKQAMFMCFNNASNMLRLLAGTEIRPLLYFAPDSVHVLTAYASAFLVKICLSVPHHISSELYDKAIHVLHDALTVFKQQNASSNTGCALQSRFLANVIRDFDRAMQFRLPTRADAGSGSPLQSTIRPQHLRSSNSQHRSQSRNSVSNSTQNFLDDSIRTRATRTASQAPKKDNQGNVAAISRSLECGVLDDFGEDQTSNHVMSGIAVSPSLSLHDIQGQLGATRNEFDNEGINCVNDFLFTDDELWTSMFAHAGFNLDDGVFLFNP